jgi:anti-anti-sigma factor
MLHGIDQSLNYKRPTTRFRQGILRETGLAAQGQVAAAVLNFDLDDLADPAPSAHYILLDPVGATVFDRIVQCLCCSEFQIGPDARPHAAGVEKLLHFEQRPGDETRIRLKPTLPGLRRRKVCHYRSGPKSASRSGSSGRKKRSNPLVIFIFIINIVITIYNEMKTLEAEIFGTTLKMIVKLARLDASTVRDFRRESQEIWHSKINDVSADLSRVSFLDSSGVGALLSLYKRLPRPYPDFRLQGVQPAVRAVIELLRLHRVFDVETEELSVPVPVSVRNR